MRRTGIKIVTTSERAKQGKHAWICWYKKTKTKQKPGLTTEPEVINQIISIENGRVKRY